MIFSKQRVFIFWFFIILLHIYMHEAGRELGQISTSNIDKLGPGVPTRAVFLFHSLPWWWIGHMIWKFGEKKYRFFLCTIVKYNCLKMLFKTTMTFDISNTDINGCDSQSCYGRGQCHDQGNDYRCDCSSGFFGKNCEGICTFDTILFWPSLG